MKIGSFSYLCSLEFVMEQNSQLSKAINYFKIVLRLIRKSLPQTLNAEYFSIPKAVTINIRQIFGSRLAVQKVCS